MNIDFPSYESIHLWKKEQIQYHLDNTKALNDFHDIVMQNVYTLAIQRLNAGSPPCSFTWFSTGSGGRREQGILSDQDHGIIYAVSNEDYAHYFLALGKEIAFGMNIVGYPYCSGNVMSSNPIWCKSINQWKEQLQSWMEEQSWESLRYLQIFYDARQIIGPQHSIDELKDYIISYKQNHPMIMSRLMDNIMHIKKAIGPFGNIIIEEKGPHYGCINLKYTAFIPYTNSIRILAMNEGIYETSTYDRITQLSKQANYYSVLKDIKGNFEELLNLRLALTKSTGYDDSHYLSIKNASSHDIKRLKKILRDGQHLHKNTIHLIKKDVYYGI